mmetsp:Transcript_21761/g.36431  ORF Transcript_21761/g.36431 Transcript_21761/m.36431 type:complete len:103 (+) Transcript_21761:549-857(+)
MRLTFLTELSASSLQTIVLLEEDGFPCGGVTNVLVLPLLVRMRGRLPHASSSPPLPLPCPYTCCLAFGISISRSKSSLDLSSISSSADKLVAAVVDDDAVLL